MVEFPWSFLLDVEKLKDNDNRIAVKHIIEQDKGKNNFYVQNMNIPPRILEIINECLQVNADKRPCLENIIGRLKNCEIELGN